MKRKLIKQGKGALTISLPKKWIEFNEISAGQEIEIVEEDNNLIIKTKPGKYEKEISLVFAHQKPEAYRNIIASLYRGGYDKIKIKFSDRKDLSSLQRVTDSLHGFEIFNIDENSCIIKRLYSEEFPDIDLYIKKMIYTISEMNSIICKDLKKKEFNSEREISKLRNDILKQRDLIMRIIKDRKLFDNKHFPYYNLSISLWNIARNYYHLYLNLNKKERYLTEDVSLLEKIEEYFEHSFNKLKYVGINELIERNEEYAKIRKEVIRRLKEKGKNALIPSMCLNIIFSVQFADSSIYLLNQD